MKNLLLTGTALALVSGEALAGGLRGSYASIEGGGTWFHHERLGVSTIFTGTTPTDYQEFQAEYSTGWALLGSIGYAFDSGLRTELELGYRHNELNRLYDSTASTVPGGGEFSTFTVMANALYDIPTSDAVTVTLGGGIGGEQASLCDGTQTQRRCLSDSSWQFAYQAIIGVNYTLSDRANLFVNYRYLNSTPPDFVLVDEANDFTQVTSFLADINRHTVTLGLRYGFEATKAR
jgi:opacity protein-like surface antigen